MQPKKLKNLIRMVKMVVTMEMITTIGLQDLLLHTKNRKNTNIIKIDRGQDQDLHPSMITEVVETENELVKKRKKYEPVQGQEAEVLSRPKKESTDIITITTTRINQDIVRGLETAGLIGVEVV